MINVVENLLRYRSLSIFYLLSKLKNKVITLQFLLLRCNIVDSIQHNAEVKVRTSF